MIVNNGISERKLTDAEMEALLDALVLAKKEKIKAMEKANSLSNRKLTPEDFGIPTIDSLINVFSL